MKNNGLGLNLNKMNKNDSSERNSDPKENLITAHLLIKIIESLISAKEINLKEFLDGILEGLDNNTAEQVEFLLRRLFVYLKIDEQVINNLFDEDDEITKFEFGTIVDKLISHIDEGKDIYSFVLEAVFNDDLPNLDGIDEDSIIDVDYDWQFYKGSSIKDCKTGVHPTNPIAKTKQQKCVIGFKNGIKGFWRYAKSIGEGQEYKKSSFKSDYAKSHKAAIKKGLVKMKTKKHSASAEKKREKSNKARQKAKMSFFSGYGKSGKTSNKAGV